MVVSHLVFCNDCFYKSVQPDVANANNMQERHWKSNGEHDVGCYIISDSQTDIEQICEWET